MKTSIRTKRFYSLIEILVAVAILISLLGLVSFNIRSASKDQAFQNEAEHVLSVLRLAQDMLVVLNIETHIEFSEGQAVIIPVGNINDIYERLVEREKIPLTAFSEVVFEDAGDEFHGSKFKLRFLDNGYTLSRGTLKFASKSGKELYIFLPGYPAPLALTNTLPDAAKDLRDYQELCERLTQCTLADPNVQN